MKYLGECSNCSHEQELTENNIYKDDLGIYAICKVCGCSFDITEIKEDIVKLN